ncbi:methyltransferase domain-containing protein [Candidatus Bathyarchaeota archaeon]|nr:methyltransferase domain-containing protein [Candidatus Bathyarchaeota archaeon]
MKDWDVEAYIASIDWNGRLSREIPLLSRCMQQLSSEDSGSSTLNVLDLGCGPGKHLLALARKFPLGSYLGIDIDDRMITKANELYKHDSEKGLIAPTTHLHFALMDIMEFSKANECSMHFLYSIGNSLSLIWNDSGCRKTFDALHRIMKPKGILLFHVLNPCNPRDGYSSSGIKQLDDGSECFTIKRFYPDLERKKMDFDLVVMKRRVGSVKHDIYPNQMSYPLIHVDAIQSILESTGFHEVSLYGGYGGEPFKTPTSGSLVCKARA